MPKYKYKPCQPGDKAWDDRLWSYNYAHVKWSATQPPDHFRPDHSPNEMSLMGVFGNAYWGGPEGEERRQMIPLLHRPRASSYTDIRGRQCKSENHFNKRASLSRDWWLDRQLIAIYDPLGWYEWYFWYCIGRRIEGYDDWQIDRWVKFKSRHIRQKPGDGRAQALLHWGIRAPWVM